MPRRSSAAVSRRDSGLAGLRDSAGSHRSSGNGGGTAYHVIAFDAKAEASIRAVKEKVDSFELGQRKLHAFVNRMNLRMDDIASQHERWERVARSQIDEAEARTADVWDQMARLEASLEGKADVFALEAAVEGARMAAEEVLAAAEIERAAAANATKYAGSTISCISCAAALDPPGVGYNAPPPPHSLPLMASAEFSSGGVNRVALLPNTHAKATMSGGSGGGGSVSTPHGGGFFSFSSSSPSSSSRSPYATKGRSPVSVRGGGKTQPQSAAAPGQQSGTSPRGGQGGGGGVGGRGGKSVASRIASAPFESAAPSGGVFGAPSRHQSHHQTRGGVVASSCSTPQADDAELAVEFPPSPSHHGGVAASPLAAMGASTTAYAAPTAAAPAATTPFASTAGVPETYHGVSTGYGPGAAVRPTTSGGVFCSPLDGDLTLSQTLINGELPRGGLGGGTARAKPQTSGEAPGSGRGSRGWRHRHSPGGHGVAASPSRQHAEHVWGGL